MSENTTESISVFGNIREYLNKVSKSFDNTNIVSQSDIDDTLRKFSCMTSEYEQFSSAETAFYNFSADDYNALPDNEKEIFNLELVNFRTLVISNITQKTGIVVNWLDIFTLMMDKVYSACEKKNRRVMYSSVSSNRPIGDPAYDTWNGLQIIDVDIKNADVANKLKPLLFKEMSKFHWFVGCSLSASKKSLHIWTKIFPISRNRDNMKVEFMCNFRHKYSYVYMVIMKFASELGISSDDVKNYMDMAMAKPQQGIFIASDSNPLMNVRFKDERLDVNFESAYNNGVESIDWISHPELKQIFSKLSWFSGSENESKTEVSELSNIEFRDDTKSVKKHYKHAQRWQLANTLTAIYGADKAIQILSEICSNTPLSELKGDVKTAEIHDKPVSDWAIQELNKCHGFKIQQPDKAVTVTENVNNGTVNVNPVEILVSDNNKVTLNITSKQYLSDIKDDILANLGKMTLLEAGAGYGKTEMIKSFKGKTLLILPFVSTIKAKVEASETTKDWLYFYGKKRLEPGDLLSDYSMSMTLDKFSNINLFELNAANFEYIVVDESHLLFTSSYRGVMSGVLQRLANIKAKVILMTGTPTGERVFFPNVKHIKVIKEETREKQFVVHFTPTKNEQLIEMTALMAKDIMEGRKVLFPTNKGNLFYEIVTGLIQQRFNEMNYTKPLTAFYYKKSNYGDKTMDSINFDKSIGNNDIIFCTTYLSVGVDICDRFEFSVYFDEMWIPQDIEQFANRLRNNNLYLHLFLPKRDASDMPINYQFTQPFNLTINDVELLTTRDMLHTLNDMLERNGEQSMYNPINSQILTTTPYFKYNEDDVKYYVDETKYKLDLFENSFSNYFMQLTPLCQWMKNEYGYTLNSINSTREADPGRVEEVKEFVKSCRSTKYNYNTVQTFDFLSKISDANIDLYKELTRGNYEIFRDEKYKELRGDNNLYVEDIEILEKNIPYVLSFYNDYDLDTIKDIFEFCLEKKQNRINYTKLRRIRKFCSIERNRRRFRLDFPVQKFIREAQAWADLNMEVEKQDLDGFINEWTAKYANMIPDLVVDDVEYLKRLKDYISELFNVVVVVDRPKKGKIKIKSFELLWERKMSLNDIYKNNITKEFFLQELVGNMKPQEEIELEQKLDAINEEVDNKSLPHTRKFKLEHIKSTLKNVIHAAFDYDTYSEQDGSNKRFLIKQDKENPNKDTLFNTSNINEVIKTDNNLQQDLFS